MKLYCFPVAPNPTRVRLYLGEKAQAGHDFDIEEVTVNLPQGDQRDPEFLAINPSGRVPVLELDDGSRLTESLVIIEYLEERAPDPPLIGKEALERARVRELERMADVGVLAHVARYVHATNSPLGWEPEPVVAEKAQVDLAAGLAQLETRLSDGRSFVAGERVTVADCTLAAALQFGRFGGIDFSTDRWPHLMAWDERFRARPVAQKVLVL